MKSVGLLSSNLPRIIYRSNLPPSRETQHFSVFISILMITQETQKTDDRTDSRNADSRNGDSRNKPVTAG